MDLADPTNQRSPRPSWWLLGFKPIRDMFVFKGRSTRSEVMAFWLIGMLANAFTISTGAIHAAPGTATAIDLGWSFLWAFPGVALLARRLHDQGRTAKWLILLGSILGLDLLVAALLPQGQGGFTETFLVWQFHPVGSVTTALLGIVGVGAIIMAWVATLLPGEPGPNRFGPDPRLNVAT